MEKDMYNKTLMNWVGGGQGEISQYPPPQVRPSWGPGEYYRGQGFFEKGRGGGFYEKSDPGRKTKRALIPILEFELLIISKFSFCREVGNGRKRERKREG